MAFLDRLVMTAANRHDVGQVRSTAWIPGAHVDGLPAHGLRAGPVPVVKDVDRRQRDVGGRDRRVELDGAHRARARLREHRGRVSNAEDHAVEVALRQVTMRLRVRGIELDRLAEARDALFEILRAERLSKEASSEPCLIRARVDSSGERACRRGPGRRTS